MKQQFKEFNENIRLNDTQEAEAKKKYDKICKILHDAYYDTTYNGSTKFLFGSYKTKTNTRPLSSDQDVDVLFKIPFEVYEKFKAYESNGQSALLQEIRNHLINDDFKSSELPKAWGKVVLITFPENQHNIEVLPAYEQEDGTFIIPNSENGGSWDVFDPKEQLDTFYGSNSNTDGLTADLTRMIKTWVKTTSSCDYKSFYLLNDVITFTKLYYPSGAEYSKYPQVVRDFFYYLSLICSEDIKSYVETALGRADKALEYEKNELPKEASQEWRKVFGKDGKSEFPEVKENPTTQNSAPTIFTKAVSPYAKTYTK